MKNTYFFVRHAEGENNVLRQSNTHDPLFPAHLTVRGVEHAKEIASTLASRVPKGKLPIVFSSPFLRSLETAKPFAESFNVEISTTNDLREIEEPVVDGAPFADLPHREEKLAECFDTPPVGAEHFLAIVKRVQDFLLKCEQKYSGEFIFAFTHGAPLKMLRHMKDGKATREGIIAGWNQYENPPNGDLEVYP